MIASSVFSHRVTVSKSYNMMLFNRLFGCVDWIVRVTVMLMQGGG